MRDASSTQTAGSSGCDSRPLPSLTPSLLSCLPALAVTTTSTSATTVRVCVRLLTRPDGCYERLAVAAAPLHSGTAPSSSWFVPSASLDPRPSTSSSSLIGCKQEREQLRSPHAATRGATARSAWKERERGWSTLSRISIGHREEEEEY